MATTNKNVILIVADEMRADCVGAYGNTVVRTPNTDCLGEHGVVFTNHFTNHTKCVPARCALYSGRYPNLGGHRTLGVPLQRGEENLASLLQKSGYYTALFQRNHTIEEGWKEQIFNIHVKTAAEHPNFTLSKSVTAEEAARFYWGIIDDPSFVSTDARHTELFLQWLDAYPAKSKVPFFANINWLYPHPPFNCSRRFADLYPVESLQPFPTCADGDKPLYVRAIKEIYGDLDRTLTLDLKRKIIQAYLGQISECDYLLGQIVSKVKELGLWENTILLFMSDHGDYAGQYNLLEKWDTGFEDCLIHVPLLMAGGGLPEGVRITGLTEHIDIFPSLCEMLGVKIPYGVQGSPFLNMISNPLTENKQYVYCEGGHEKALLDVYIDPAQHGAGEVCYQKKATVRQQYPDTLRKAKMIRTKTAKYVYRVVEGDELYDLAADPDECNNIAHKQEAQRLKLEMKDMLLKHLIENEETRPFDPHPIA